MSNDGLRLRSSVPGTRSSSDDLRPLLCSLERRDFSASEVSGLRLVLDWVDVELTLLPREDGKTSAGGDVSWKSGWGKEVERRRTAHVVVADVVRRHVIDSVVVLLTVS